MCLKTPFQTIHDAHFLWILFLIVTGGFFHTLTGPYLTRLHKQNSVRNTNRWVAKQELFDKKTPKQIHSSFAGIFQRLLTGTADTRVPERFLVKTDLSFYHSGCLFILAAMRVMARRINNAQNPNP